MGLTSLRSVPEKDGECLCLALSLIRLETVRVHWLLEVILITNSLLYPALCAGGVKEGKALT